MRPINTIEMLRYMAKLGDLVDREGQYLTSILVSWVFYEKLAGEEIKLAYNNYGNVKFVLVTDSTDNLILIPVPISIDLEKVEKDSSKIVPLLEETIRFDEEKDRIVGNALTKIVIGFLEARQFTDREGIYIPEVSIQEGKLTCRILEVDHEDDDMVPLLLFSIRNPTDAAIDYITDLYINTLALVMTDEKYLKYRRHIKSMMEEIDETCDEYSRALVEAVQHRIRYFKR